MFITTDEKIQDPGDKEGGWVSDSGKYQSWASNLRVLTTYMPVFLQYYHDFKWEALGMDQHRKTGGAEEKEKNLKGVFPSEIPV